MRAPLFCLCVTVFFCHTTHLQAQENLLGVPAALNPATPGALVLHGGGRVTDDVFDRFVELAGGRQAKIVFVPCAGYRRGWYESDEAMIEAVSYRYSAWAQLPKGGHIKQFQFLFTDDPEEANNPEFVKTLETATGVWFSGGDQDRLNYRFVEFPNATQFQRALQAVIQRGGVVGGTSAGMAAIPEIMTLWDERESFDAPAAVVPGHGLGLLRQAIVEQHFDARGGRLERFTSLLRDNQRLDELSQRRGAGSRMLGLAVEESSALIIRGNHLQALGNANSHVFIKSTSGKSIAWHQMSPGDTAELTRRTARAPSLEFEQTVLAE
jgi:cyanophycinase